MSIRNAASRHAGDEPRPELAYGALCIRQSQEKRTCPGPKVDSSPPAAAACHRELTEALAILRGAPAIWQRRSG